MVRLANLNTDATMVPGNAIILSTEVLRDTRSRLQQDRVETEW